MVVGARKESRTNRGVPRNEQGLDYEEVNRISFLEDKLSALQDKYDKLEENLQHPLVKLVSDIEDEKNKWELADQIVIVKKSWAWKNKTNLNVI